MAFSLLVDVSKVWLPMWGCVAGPKNEIRLRLNSSHCVDSRLKNIYLTQKYDDPTDKSVYFVKIIHYSTHLHYKRHSITRIVSEFSNIRGKIGIYRKKIIIHSVLKMKLNSQDENSLGRTFKLK